MHLTCSADNAAARHRLRFNDYYYHYYGFDGEWCGETGLPNPITRDTQYAVKCSTYLANLHMANIYVCLRELIPHD